MLFSYIRRINILKYSEKRIKVYKFRFTFLLKRDIIEYTCISK